MKSHIDPVIAWNNAIMAVPTDEPFFKDLAKSVTNDGSEESAGRWMLSFVSDFLRGHGRPDGPWKAFDFAIYDIEAICGIWPLVRKAADMSPVPAGEVLPTLARFLVERMPAVWERDEPWHEHKPVASAVILADRIDTLVTMFAAGFKPNGSKDPYALRRAAITVLLNIMVPCPVGRKMAA